MAIGVIADLVGSFIKSWSKRREQEINARTEVLIHEAKARAEIAKIKAQTVANVEAAKITHDIEWELLRVKDAKNTWVDELWSLIIAATFLAGFFPYTAQFQKQGFENLETAPDWYVAVVGVAISFAFGYRRVANLMERRKPKKYIKKELPPAPKRVDQPPLTMEPIGK